MGDFSRATPHTTYGATKACGELLWRTTRARGFSRRPRPAVADDLCARGRARSRPLLAASRVWYGLTAAGAGCGAAH